MSQGRLTRGAPFFSRLHSYDCLAVGAPGVDEISTVNAGRVATFQGKSGGPLYWNVQTYDQSSHGDPAESFDRFGAALAFGAFDGTHRGTLVAGVPGEDLERGMVHVIAPWRQVLDLGSHSAIVVDCEDNIVFSQNPFDEACNASTTKIMTVLIACERSQLPPGHPLRVNLSEVYTVPDWIINEIGGSRFEFYPGERIRLIDLLHACIKPSGNDAAYAIADLLTGADNEWEGSYPATCADFVAEMNARAAAIGMTQTHFSNPAGLSVGNHYSTPYDMVKLGRVAMENALLREIVGTIEYAWTRQVTLGGIPLDLPYLQGYAWLKGLKDRSAAMNGIKPGWTPCAGKTGVFSAYDPTTGGDALACTFASPKNPNSRYLDDGAALTALGAEHCGPGLTIHPGASSFQLFLPGLLTEIGKQSGGGAILDPPLRVPSSVIDIFRTGGTEPTSCRLEIGQSGELEFSENQEIDLGIAPFQSHGTILIKNHGEHEARFLVAPSYGGEPIELVLLPGDGSVIPPHEGPTLPELTITITNRSGELTRPLPMLLSVSVIYKLELTDLEAPGIGTPVASIELKRPESMEDAFNLLAWGLDPRPGSTLMAVVHDAGEPASVGESGANLQDTAVLSLRPASPEPFARRTRFSFELKAPGKVEVSVFDVEGRTLRTVHSGTLGTGDWNVTWDGTDAGGARVPAGVYFYRVEYEGREQAGGRVTLIR